MTPVPSSLLRSGRDLTEPRPSPDGRRVAFAQRWRGAASISCVDLDGGPEQVLSVGFDPAPGRGLGGGCFAWLSPSALVACGADGELWLQDGATTARVTDLGRTVRAPAVAAGAVVTDGDGLGGRSPVVVVAVDEAEIHLVDLATGDARRLDDGRHEFCFDPALSPDGTTASWQGWSPPDMPWDGAWRVDVDLATGAIDAWRPDDGAVQQPRFAPDGTPAHVHDGSGWLNVHVGDRAPLPEAFEHAGPTWGMGARSWAIDAAGDRLALARNEGGFGSLVVVDLATGAAEAVGRGVHGQLSWVGDVIVALRSGARTPTQVVAQPVGGGPRRSLALSHAAPWPLDELPEPATIEVPSSVDGLTLHARRYAAGRGRLLAMVHGGPTDQWEVDWRPRITTWWSRGWDVLVVDPRGTTGHGRSYQRALHGRWGRADVDDTADLIAHAHRAGWATPATTALLGGSSGGLTVLGVLADHPGLVAGGVASYPVSDLRALAEATHRFEAHYTDTLVAPDDGSEASADRFRALSPISRATSITAPLLVFHGSDDPVVPLAQSEALVDAIEAGGGSVELVVYDGEGHGFRDPDHVADEHERTEAFLERLVTAGAAPTHRRTTER